MTRSSQEIEREIEQTRHEMDETLEAVEERVNPRHLLDEVLDYFRSPGDGGRSRMDSTAQSARQITKRMVRQVKDHPVPALLCGAGLAWLLLESDDEPRHRNQAEGLAEHSGSFVDAYTGQPYRADGGYARAAWHEDYDWAEEDEQSWTEQARQSMKEIQNTIADSSKSAAERVRSVAHHLRGMSGKKYQSQWRDLRSHSGSFVDARTGQPYDDTYGQGSHPWTEAEGLDFIAESDKESDGNDWTSIAQELLDQLKETFSNTSHGVKRRLSQAASQTSQFAGKVRGRTSQMGQQMRSGIGHMGHQVQRGYAHASQRTGDLAHSASHRASEAAHYTKDRTRDAIEEYPLAVGAACLGLGMLVGLLLPETEAENRWMGEASDDLKDQASRKGQEALERGKHVVEETAQAAMDEAERQGLTPEQLGKKTRETASRVKDTMQEESDGLSSIPQKAKRVAERATEEAKDQSKREAKSFKS